MINNAAVNILVHDFLSIYVHFSFGYLESLGSYGMKISNFSQYLQFFKVVATMRTPTNSVWSSYFSTCSLDIVSLIINYQLLLLVSSYSCSTTMFSHVLSYLNDSDKCTMIFYCDLNFHFPDN